MTLASGSSDEPSGAAAGDLPHLLRLLDDSDPAVSPAVRDRLASMGGDISHDLAALGIAIDSKGRQQLSRILAPARREALRDEWLVPTNGAAGMADDWDSFENTLRQLSDFLHDGVTLRPSLPDALDLLVDEISEDHAAPSADDLRHWLFVSGRFTGASQKADQAQLYDLCHVMDSRRGNPTSLACLYMLVGRRMHAQVHGCNYPGHFLARIHIDGTPHLIDCFHRGRKFNIETLLISHPEISDRAKAAVVDTGHLGLILLRYVIELQRSFRGSGRSEDALLFKELAGTLQL